MNALMITANVLFLVFGMLFYSMQCYLFSIICLIAFANYSAMNCDVGKVTSQDGVIDYLPRYLDWIVTTPLLLLSLIQLSNIKDTKLIVFLLICDVLMIYIGYLATLTQDHVFRLILFFISTFFLFYIFTILLNHSPPKFPTMYLFIIWLCYPIFWILHETKTGITNDTYNYIMSALDIIAKIGFGLLFYVFKLY